jgi:hypothetical protein
MSKYSIIGHYINFKCTLRQMELWLVVKGYGEEADVKAEIPGFRQSGR